MLTSQSCSEATCSKFGSSYENSTSLHVIDSRVSRCMSALSLVCRKLHRSNNRSRRMHSSIAIEAAGTPIIDLRLELQNRRPAQ